MKHWKLATIGLIQNYLKTSNSKQTPPLETYTNKQLIQVCHIYNIKPIPIAIKSNNKV